MNEYRKPADPPLVVAATEGHVECIELLIHTESNDNRYGLKALTRAAEGGHSKYVELLIDEINNKESHAKGEKDKVLTKALIKAAEGEHKTVSNY